MLNFKTFLIAIAITFLMLAGFVNSSDAAEITGLSASVPDDWGEGANVSAHLATDEDVLWINWDVNGEDEWTSMHSSGTRWVNVDLDTLTGDIKGNKYTITAETWFFDGDNCISDTKSYTFRVYKPIVKSGYNEVTWEKPRITGAYGYVEISRHYFNGTTFVMDAYAYAYNGTDETLRAQAWFRQTEYTAPDGIVIDEKQDTKDLEDVKTGKTYGPYTPDSFIINFDNDGLIGKDEVRYFDAHTHLQVTTVAGLNFVQDDWEVDTTILTFAHVKSMCDCF